MNIEELVRRATRDPEFAEHLRALAYEARDSGMKSPAYRKLLQATGLAETAADRKALNSSMGYLMVLNGTLSKVQFLCLLPDPGSSMTLPKPMPATRGARSTRTAAKATRAAKNTRS